jgi:hypothetical protein
MTFHFAPVLAPVDDRGAVASCKSRTSGLTVAPSFIKIALAYMRSVMSV